MKKDQATALLLVKISERCPFLLIKDGVNIPISEMVSMMVLPLIVNIFLFAKVLLHFIDPLTRE